MKNTPSFKWLLLTSMFSLVSTLAALRLMRQIDSGDMISSDGLLRLIHAFPENLPVLTVITFLISVLSATVFRVVLRMSVAQLDSRRGSQLLAFRILSNFRWFLPRAQREEIDLIIADLKEDKSELIRQKRSKKFIFIVLSWHVARIMSAYVWDGVTSIAKKVIPLTKYLPK